MESADRLRIAREWSIPQAPRYGVLDHLRFIHIVERRRHSLARGFAVDAHGLHLAHDAGPAMASHDQVVARPGPRGAGVVERAGGLKISKCLIDNAVGKSSAMQSVAKLARRELAAAEEEQGGRPSGSRSGILHDLWLTPGHARMVHRRTTAAVGPDVSRAIVWPH